jgi:hypothetical protein
MRRSAAVTPESPARITFTLRTLTGYIAPVLTPIYDRRWSCMMEKAGYLQRTGCQALDSEGLRHEVLELHICGTRYAVRRSDLVRAVSGRVMIQVEELTRNWEYYLGATCGLAQISVSGKALNVDLFGSGSFTLSLSALRAVLYGRERICGIVRIPVPSPQRIHRVVEGQQTIGAMV